MMPCCGLYVVLYLYIYFFTNIILYISIYILIYIYHKYSNSFFKILNNKNHYSKKNSCSKKSTKSTSTRKIDYIYYRQAEREERIGKSEKSEQQAPVSRKKERHMETTRERERERERREGGVWHHFLLEHAFNICEYYIYIIIVIFKKIYI